MSTRIKKRIYRSATAEEKARHKKIRDQIQEELPEIKERAKQKLSEAIENGVEIQHIISLLKVERTKRGLSLAEIKEKTGIERSTLSRLENSKDVNPTISTLTRYAEAVGKKVLVVLKDDSPDSYEAT